MVHPFVQLVVCFLFFLSLIFLPSGYQPFYPGCYDFLTLFPRSFLHRHSSFRQHHIEYPGGSPYPHVIKILLQIRQNHLQGAPINTPFSLYLRGLQPKPTTWQVTKAPNRCTFVEAEKRPHCGRLWPGGAPLGAPPFNPHTNRTGDTVWFMATNVTLRYQFFLSKMGFLILDQIGRIFYGMPIYPILFLKSQQSGLRCVTRANSRCFS